MASQNPHELDKDRTCTRCSQPFHSTAVTRDTMWPEPTINVTQRHLFCELKDLFWPPVLTELWLQFEVLCCSSLTLRQPVSLYGICSSDKLMQECTWVCVVKNSPQIFFNFFFFVRMADGVYKCILPVGVRVCVRVDLHAFPLCMLSKQFLLSANRRHFSRNFILVPVSVFRARNRSISDLDIWLLRKWTHNTVMWPVKGMCPEWFFFFFFFLQGHVNEYFQFKTDDSWCLCSAWIIQYLAVLYFTLSTGTHAH